MIRLQPHQVDPTGAAPGDVLTYDPATDAYVPAPSSGGGGLVPLTTLSSTGELVFIRSASGALIMVEASA